TVVSADLRVCELFAFLQAARRLDDTSTLNTGRVPPTTPRGCGVRVISNLMTRHLRSCTRLAGATVTALLKLRLRSRSAGIRIAWISAASGSAISAPMSVGSPSGSPLRWLGPVNGERPEQVQECQGRFDTSSELSAARLGHGTGHEPGTGCFRVVHGRTSISLKKWPRLFRARQSRHKKARINGGPFSSNALFLIEILVATGGLEPPTPAL